MAHLVDSIFTEKATERLHSPEDLDAYVRVINPSVWIALLPVQSFSQAFYRGAYSAR